jgi:hypothetical protein
MQKNSMHMSSASVHCTRMRASLHVPAAVYEQCRKQTPSMPATHLHHNTAAYTEQSGVATMHTLTLAAQARKQLDQECA